MCACGAACHLSVPDKSPTAMRERVHPRTTATSLSAELGVKSLEPGEKLVVIKCAMECHRKHVDVVDVDEARNNPAAEDLEGVGVKALQSPPNPCLRSMMLFNFPFNVCLHLEAAIDAMFFAMSSEFRKLHLFEINFDVQMTRPRLRCGHPSSEHLSRAHDGRGEHGERVVATDDR